MTTSFEVGLLLNKTLSCIYEYAAEEQLPAISLKYDRDTQLLTVTTHHEDEDDCWVESLTVSDFSMDFNINESKLTHLVDALIYKDLFLDLSNDICGAFGLSSEVTTITSLEDYDKVVEFINSHPDCEDAISAYHNWESSEWEHRQERGRVWCDYHATLVDLGEASWTERGILTTYHLTDIGEEMMEEYIAEWDEKNPAPIWGTWLD